MNTKADEKIGMLVHRAETGDGLSIDTGNGLVDIFAVKISAGEVKLAVSAPKDMRITKVRMKPLPLKT